ncbi:MAG: beta-aspartyl-peptidase [Odoribacteraceae bacterium]|jgi:beta-aspartyl-dipeptidase (metallo-type)|nr:beta-aspartyl-peptidase [Odoribacteraceae bacterium]
MKLVKNANVLAPEAIGTHDLLVGGGKILLVERSIRLSGVNVEVIDAAGLTLTPGLIDQHVHVTGAGGQQGFDSMTPPVELGSLVACGTTTVVGLLGTDSSTRDLQSLYAKTRALDREGITAYMLTGSFAYPPVTITGSVRGDLLFIDKVLGCKIAISDERSSFPTAGELARLVADIHVAGMLSGKGGILHVHVGALDSRLGVLLELVERYQLPIRRLSPTHVGRTAALFDEAIRFALHGGMIDISTGGTRFDEPYKQALLALQRGVPLSRITFSSDGNAGVVRKDADGRVIDYRRAPLDRNLEQVIKLITDGGLAPADAFRLVTSNPAANLSLPRKGRIVAGADADFCLFDEHFTLRDVFAGGEALARDGVVLKKGNFEIHNP